MSSFVLNVHKYATLHHCFNNNNALQILKLFVWSLFAVCVIYHSKSKNFALISNFFSSKRYALYELNSED